MWQVFYDGGTGASETNGRLEITFPAISSGYSFAAGYQSKFLLVGDYDMQVKYDLLAWPATNGVRIGFSTVNSAVERVSCGSLEGYSPKEAYVADGFVSTTLVGTNDATGK